MSFHRQSNAALPDGVPNGPGDFSKIGNKVQRQVGEYEQAATQTHGDNTRNGFFPAQLPNSPDQIHRNSCGRGSGVIVRAGSPNKKEGSGAEFEPVPALEPAGLQ